MHSPDFELGHYINTFRASSDRVRVVIYGILIACGVFFALSWNTRDMHWTMRRFEEWQDLMQEKAEYDFDQAHKGNKPVAPFLAERRRQRDFEIRSHLTTLQAHTDWMREFMGRTILINVPLLGTSFDVNDLGVVGGALLVVLNALLLFCLSRQHENLYLCTFKVGRLCDDDRLHDRDPENGESAANFLYHALVMTQVLNHPPTLARWRRDLRARILGGIRLGMFFIPTAAYLYVLSTDILADVWMTPREKYTEFAILGIVLLENVFAVLFVSACEEKWRRMFFSVNPKHESLATKPWLHWMNIELMEPWPSQRGPLPEEAKLRRVIGGDITQQDDVWRTHEVTVEHTLKLARPPEISDRDRFGMARALNRKAHHAVHGARPEDEENTKFGEPEVLENVIHQSSWTTRVKWPYERRAAGGDETREHRKRQVAPT